MTDLATAPVDPAPRGNGPPSGRRHRRHANPFSRPPMRAPPPLPPALCRAAPWGLDVGCGSGQFTAHLAAAHPEWNVLGLEMRAHLVAQARARLAAAPHAWAQLCNAVTDLPLLVPPAQVRLVAVNFPDPWFKRRHHKRRLVSASWLAALAPLLAEGAVLHLATDQAPLAAAMRAEVAKVAAWVPWPSCRPFAAASTTGWASERELTHLGRGERIWRLAYHWRP